MKYESRCQSCGGRFTFEEFEAGEILHCPHCRAQIQLQPPPDSSAEQGSGEESEAGIWPTLIRPAKISKPGASTIETPFSDGKDCQADKPGFLAEVLYDPEAEFRRDLVRFIVPCRTKEEVPTLIVIAFLFVVWPYLNMFSFFCCLNWLIQLAVLGCFCTFFFEIVTETARGGDQLPYFGSISAALENFWAEIIVPAINFICAVLYCQIPAILGGIILQGIVPPTESTECTLNGIADPNAVGVLAGETVSVWHPAAEAILTVLTIAGMFFLPMVMLILAFDKIQLLLRPDIIWKAIRQLLRPYLLGWISILVGGGIFWLTRLLLPEQDAEEYVLGTYGHIAVVSVLMVIDLLVFIYAMRVVGLLYRHYEHLLPWPLEPRKKHPLEE